MNLFRFAFASSKMSGLKAVQKPAMGGLRTYHQTKNTKTVLLNSKPSSEYAVMSLNSLKNECRKRGVKVGGRKQELMNRLIHNDRFISSNSRGISSTVNASAKGDDSHIDYFKLPNLLNETVEIETPVKILSLKSNNKKDDFQGKRLAQVNSPKNSEASAILTVDGDSGKVLSDTPIHHNLEVKPTELPSVSSTLPSLTSDPVNYIENLLSTPETIVAGETSNAKISSNSDQVLTSVTSEKQQHDTQDYKFTNYEKEFFGYFTVGVTTYWVLFGYLGL